MFYQNAQSDVNHTVAGTSDIMGNRVEYTSLKLGLGLGLGLGLWFLIFVLVIVRTRRFGGGNSHKERI